MPEKVSNFPEIEYKVFPGDIHAHPNVEKVVEYLVENKMVGEGTIFHDCKVLGPIQIGKNCVIGNYTILEKGVVIGDGTKVWHFNHLRPDCKLGKNCVVGDYVYIDFGVKIGDECKVQNHVSIYHGVTLGNGVFLGPNCRTTNDTEPRSRMPGGGLRGEKDWVLGTIMIEDDASIGAGATLVANNITIGRASMVGAGAVVTKDVEPYTVVVGVPARKFGDVKDKDEYEKIKADVRK